MFQISIGWRDSAGKVRSWIVRGPDGGRIVETTRKGEAQTVCFLLEQLEAAAQEGGQK